MSYEKIRRITRTVELTCLAVLIVLEAIAIITSQEILLHILTICLGLFVVVQIITEIIVIIYIKQEEKRDKRHIKSVLNYTNEFKKIKLLIPTELMRKVLNGYEAQAKRSGEEIEVKISFLDDLNNQVSKTISLDEEYAEMFILEIED